MRTVYTSLLTGLAGACLATATLQAQTATTDPVGFVSYDVNANSDQKLGLPMQQASVFNGVASNVSGPTVSASGLPALTGANFLVVTDGAAVGQWEQIVASSSDSVTMAQPITGFANTDTFEIKPFWTLSTLFPNGGNITVSTDVFDPVAEVLLNDPSATGVNNAPSLAFFYFAGDADYPAGWYDSSDPDAGIKNATVLSPESLITIRNRTASSFTVNMVGSVPTDRVAFDVATLVAGPQDNPVYNMFPADVTLATSGLAPTAITPSTDVFDPGDQLLVYPLESIGFNTAAPVSYFFFAGDADYTSGWYDSSDPDGGLKNDVILPAGSAVVIRKAAGKTATAWNPPVPYTLE